MQHFRSLLRLNFLYVCKSTWVFIWLFTKIRASYVSCNFGCGCHCVPGSRSKPLIVLSDFIVSRMRLLGELTWKFIFFATFSLNDYELVSLLVIITVSCKYCYTSYMQPKKLHNVANTPGDRLGTEYNIIAIVSSNSSALEIFVKCLDFFLDITASC